MKASAAFAAPPPPPPSPSPAAVLRTAHASTPRNPHGASPCEHPRATVR